MCSLDTESSQLLVSNQSLITDSFHHQSQISGFVRLILLFLVSLVSDFSFHLICILLFQFWGSMENVHLLFRFLYFLISGRNVRGRKPRLTGNIIIMPFEVQSTCLSDLLICTLEFLPRIQSETLMAQLAAMNLFSSFFEITYILLFI